MYQNNETLRSYYKWPNIYSHIGTMISHLKFFIFHWMYVILACPIQCSANYSVCNKCLNDTKSKIKLQFHCPQQPIWLKRVILIMYILFSELYWTFSTCPWNCCPPCHYGVTAPLSNLLTFSVTLLQAFCISSTEAETVASCKASIYSYISSFSSYYVCSWMLSSLTCPPCHSEISININTSEIGNIFFKKHTVSLLTESCCQMKVHHVLK